MEPRPRGRGNFLPRLPGAYCVGNLQWSPDLAAGETVLIREINVKSSHSLQWSPDLAAGETSGQAGSLHAWIHLQWSPDLAAGETRVNSAGIITSTTAFNGAPTSRPGKRDGPGPVSSPPVEPSMEPRPRGRGNATGHHGYGDALPPFNGAPTSRPGKLRGLNYRINPQDPLQWSPDLAAGETRASARTRRAC